MITPKQYAHWRPIGIWLLVLMILNLISTAVMIGVLDISADFFYPETIDTTLQNPPESDRPILFIATLFAQIIPTWSAYLGMVLIEYAILPPNKPILNRINNSLAVSTIVLGILTNILVVTRIFFPEHDEFVIILLDLNSYWYPLFGFCIALGLIISISSATYYQVIPRELGAVLLGLVLLASILSILGMNPNTNLIRYNGAVLVLEVVAVILGLYLIINHPLKQPNPTATR